MPGPAYSPLHAQHSPPPARPLGSRPTAGSSSSSSSRGGASASAWLPRWRDSFLPPGTRRNGRAEDGKSGNDDNDDDSDDESGRHPSHAHPGSAASASGRRILGGRPHDSASPPRPPTMQQPPALGVGAWGRPPLEPAAALRLPRPRPPPRSGANDDATGNGRSGPHAAFVDVPLDADDAASLGALAPPDARRSRSRSLGGGDGGGSSGGGSSAAAARGRQVRAAVWLWRVLAAMLLLTVVTLTVAVAVSALRGSRSSESADGSGAAAHAAKPPPQPLQPVLSAAVTDHSHSDGTRTAEAAMVPAGPATAAQPQPPLLLLPSPPRAPAEPPSISGPSLREPEPRPRVVTVEEPSPTAMAAAAAAARRHDTNSASPPVATGTEPRAGADEASGTGDRNHSPHDRGLMLTVTPTERDVVDCRPVLSHTGPRSRTDPSTGGSTGISRTTPADAAETAARGAAARPAAAAAAAAGGSISSLLRQKIQCVRSRVGVSGGSPHSADNRGVDVGADGGSSGSRAPAPEADADADATPLLPPLPLPLPRSRARWRVRAPASGAHAAAASPGADAPAEAEAKTAETDFPWLALVLPLQGNGTNAPASSLSAPASALWHCGWGKTAASFLAGGTGFYAVTALPRTAEQPPLTALPKSARAAVAAPLDSMLPLLQPPQRPASRRAHSSAPSRAPAPAPATVSAAEVDTGVSHGGDGCGGGGATVGAGLARLSIGTDVYGLRRAVAASARASAGEASAGSGGGVSGAGVRSGAGVGEEPEPPAELDSIPPAGGTRSGTAAGEAGEAAAGETAAAAAAVKEEPARVVLRSSLSEPPQLLSGAEWSAFVQKLQENAEGPARAARACATTGPSADPAAGAGANTGVVATSDEDSAWTRVEAFEEFLERHAGNTQEHAHGSSESSVSPSGASLGRARAAVLVGYSRWESLAAPEDDADWMVQRPVSTTGNDGLWSFVVVGYGLI